jgi:hypothetical protein
LNRNFGRWLRLMKRQLFVEKLTFSNNENSHSHKSNSNGIWYSS